jgi:glycosyltransferase involved in cell wall biosynthesis
MKSWLARTGRPLPKPAASGKAPWLAGFARMRGGSKPRRRRVVLYIPDLSAGGAERVALNLLEALPGPDLQVTLLVNRLDGPLKASLPPGAAVVSLNASRTLEAFWPLVWYFRREKPDCLIAFLSFNNILAVWANLVAGGAARIVATIHAPLSFETKTHTSLAFRLVPLLYRATLPLAAAVVTVSRGVGTDLCETMSRVIGFTVIHNPVVTARMLDLARREVDHPWFAPGQDPVILGVGRLNECKDPRLLVEAFARLPAASRTRLMLLGDGPLRSELEALIAQLGLGDRAVLLGNTENPWRFMARARLLVLSSRYEGFGNVLVEAMATGLPVVSVDCPYGPAEILADGEWGRLAPPGDAEALSASIAAALGEPVNAAALRGRANDFSVSVVAERYRTLIAQVLRGASGTLPSSQPIDGEAIMHADLLPQPSNAAH